MRPDKTLAEWSCGSVHRSHSSGGSHLCPGVFDVIERQIQLVIMLIGTTTVFRSPVGDERLLIDATYSLERPHVEGVL